MKLGYARVSTIEQNEARQIEALEARGIDREYIYIDKLSGKNTERPKLKEMLNYSRKGDVVIVLSIDRIARNTKDLLAIVEELTNKGVDFISLHESIDTTTPQGRFMLTVFAAMAQLERENILERQREGIAIAKAEGKYTGRKAISVNLDVFAPVVKLWRTGEITAVEAMKRLELKPNTFYRRVKQYGL